MSAFLQICEAPDEELKSIVALNDPEHADKILVHCLFTKEMFTIYAKLKVIIPSIESNEEDMQIIEEQRFCFPIFASKLTVEPAST